MNHGGRIAVLTGGLLAAALISVGQSASAPGSAGAMQAQAAPIIERGRHDRYLSPNGDGRHDRARFVFRLSQRADVRVVVRNDRGDVVRTDRLGELDNGKHVWRWGGGSTAGKVQPDGDYAVVLRATARGRSDRVRLATTVLTHADAGRLLLTRPTVYPEATVVTDRVQAVYVRDHYSEVIARYRQYFGRQLPLRTRLVITDPDGERVLDRSTRRYRPTFEWSARKGGVPVAPGDYRLRLTVRDPGGNVRTINRVVTVSSAQLVEQVWTTAVAAASADGGPGPVYDPACNGCGEVCGPVPSDRYPGGLSFRQPCDFGYAAVRFFGATPPTVPAPVDSFRITAMGGPTTPGSTDTASFDGVVMGPGDVTASTPWTSVDLIHYPFVPDGTQPVTWGLSTTSGNSYDVASFTVEYRYYLPAS